MQDLVVEFFCLLMKTVDLFGHLTDIVIGFFPFGTRLASGKCGKFFCFFQNRSVRVFVFIWLQMRKTAENLPYIFRMKTFGFYNRLRSLRIFLKRTDNIHELHF